MCRYIMKALAIAAAMLLATGCATMHAPRLTATRAIELATAEAIRQRGSMSHLMPPSAIYNPEYGRWTVHWDERPDKEGMVHIGGDYWGFVDDATGHVTVQGGF